VIRYRQHDANMSRDSALMLRATLAVLRRERAYVPATHLDACRAGARAWRAFYGDHIVEHLRASWRARSWGRFEATQAWALLRHCPAMVARQLFRKLSVISRGRDAARGVKVSEPSTERRA
jgi:hypothetical protein